MKSRPFTPKVRVFRQDHYRWMREGMPNFDDQVFQKIRELEVIAKKDVKSISPVAPVMKAVEEMASSYRSLVVQSANTFVGIVTTMSVVNYLGGGELFNIVASRHNYDLYSALYNEPVESITVKNPVYVYVDEGLKEALTRMVIYGAGILPVLNRNGSVYGVITEHDLVKYLQGLVSAGVKVSQCMSSPVITISSGATLKEAMETMVRYGFRRLPVIEDNVVVGIITSVDIVRALGTHRLLERVSSRDLRDVVSIPVEELMTTNLVTVEPDEDLASAVNTMLSRNVSSVLVVGKDNVLKGIVTERDVLYAILMPK